MYLEQEKMLPSTNYKVFVMNFLRNTYRRLKLIRSQNDFLGFGIRININHIPNPVRESIMAIIFNSFVLYRKVIDCLHSAEAFIPKIFKIWKLGCICTHEALLFKSNLYAHYTHNELYLVLVFDMSLVM